MLVASPHSTVLSRASTVLKSSPDDINSDLDTSKMEDDDTEVSKFQYLMVDWRKGNCRDFCNKSEELKVLLIHHQSMCVPAGGLLLMKF